MNMVEKVARASFKCWRDRMTELGHHLDKGQTFEDMDDSEKEFAFIHARAVIEAMREPTEEMIEPFRYTASDEYILRCWSSSIDAALK